MNVIEREIIDYLPKRTPRGWQIVERREDSAAYLGPDHFSVIVSIARQEDGRWWLHVSCARPNTLPTWRDLRWVKDTFVGTGRYALQILPPPEVYVNLHPHCLHLFVCLDGWPLPEFSGFVAGMRSI